MEQNKSMKYRGKKLKLESYNLVKSIPAMVYLFLSNIYHNL